MRAYENGILPHVSSKPPTNLQDFHQRYDRSRGTASPTESEHKRYADTVEDAGNKATMVFEVGRKLLKMNQALAYLGKSDPPGYAEVTAFTTDGTNLNLYAHYAAPSEDGTQRYHQYRYKSANLVNTHPGHNQGRRGLRNEQDYAYKQSRTLKDQLREHWKQHRDAIAPVVEGAALPVADGTTGETNTDEAGYVTKDQSPGVLVIGRLGGSSTYVKFYMTDFIEAGFQEIVFGSEPQRDIIQLMGRLLRRADAPTRLTDQQLKGVHRHPRLSRLRHKNQQAVRKFQEMGFTLKTVPKTGRGGELLQEYTRWSRMADSARKTLHDDRLIRAINDFHSVRDGEEIARQLQGIRPSEYLDPPAVEYHLPERARVAKLLSQVADVTSTDELFSIRMDLVRTLMALCKLQEPRRPRQRRKSAAGKKSNARPRKAPPARQPKKR
ncbi:heterokaryon incompatibility [Fusarium albosuccineum]|uniref:Heterokaryon incompatibility n=1 Tax=Fusarium albosuccineum TaxID=1237068 RepID=A0A8H4KYD5_9HYPO|nr:heterokaryon incompatibility [Fusarium albosuccineum]